MNGALKGIGRVRRSPPDQEANMNKKTKKFASKVGSRLFDVFESVTELQYQIDMGPELSQAEDRDLLTLCYVRNLLDVAFNLYPYTIEE